MQQRDTLIVCSNESSHLYEECSHPLFALQPIFCHKEGTDIICYIWKEPFVNSIKEVLVFIKCLLSNTPSCFIRM